MKTIHMKSLLITIVLTIAFLSSAQHTPIWVTTFDETNAQLIALDHFGDNQLVAIERFQKKYRILTINQSDGDTSEILKIGGGYHFKPTQIKSDYDGNVLITGTYKKSFYVADYAFESVTNPVKTFLIKFKPGQDIDTNNIVQFESLQTNQMGILSNNDIVLSGTFRYGANVMGQELEAGLDDVFILKLKPSLTLDWVKSYGGNGDEAGTGMHILDDDHIIMSAKINREFNLGGTRQIQLAHDLISGSVLWKMNPDGQIVWHTVYGAIRYGKVWIEEIRSKDEQLFLAMGCEKGLVLGQEDLLSMGRQDVLLAQVDASGKNTTLVKHVKSPWDVQLAGFGIRENTLHLAGTFQRRIHIDDKKYYANEDTSRFINEIYYMTYNLQEHSHSFTAIGSKDNEIANAFYVGNESVFLTGNFDKAFRWGTYTLENKDFTQDGFIAAIGLKSLGVNSNPTTSSGNSSTPPRCPDPDRPTITSIQKEESNIRVHWKAVDRAAHYEIIVANNATLTDVVYQNMQIVPSEVPSLEVNGLEPGSTYFVRVFVEIDCKKREKSSIVPAKTKTETSVEDPEVQTPPQKDCEPPSPPVFRGASSTVNSVKALWHNVQGAQRYEFYLAQDPSFGSIVFQNTNIAPTLSPQQEVSNLEANKNYYAKVIVVNDCPKEASSEIKMIRTKAKTAETVGSECTPERPEITKVEPENYAFTAYWRPIADISHYNIYVFDGDNLEDTLHASKDLHVSEEPFYRVNALQGKHTYFFNVVATKKCRDQMATSRSELTEVTTTCIDDTIVMHHSDGHLQFQLVDCEGNVKCMGTDVAGNIVVIGTCNDNDAGGVEEPEKPGVTLVGPIDLNPSEDCEDHQRRVPIKEADKPFRYVCVNIEDPAPKHPCMELPTDRERLICIAQEGVDKVNDLTEEIKKRYEEMVNLSQKAEKETTSEAERLKINKRVQEELLPQHQKLVNRIDTIRMEYEQLLNAIVMNGNISIPVKSDGAGITISPEALGVYVRWSKYDDRWTRPGPQLIVEVKVANFPKRRVKSWGHQWKIEAINDIYGQSFDASGEPLSEEGLYGFRPCHEVRGTTSWNIAILNEFEHMGYQKFWNPQKKHFDPDIWQQCSGKNLTRERAQEFQNHQIMMQLFQSSKDKTVDLDALGFFPHHFFLLATTTPDDLQNESAFLAYLESMKRMSAVYYSFYEHPHIAFQLLQTLRLKVEKSYERYWYDGGYKIYYGYKELDPDIAKKVKEALR
jgi:hypothetical protein